VRMECQWCGYCATARNALSIKPPAATPTAGEREFHGRW
jgi:hypothetical protein